jgi:uncharacterized RDD family membrane protein YckC
MKCPKCLYIGFETGDRCKNCGYDFSLLAIAEAEPDAPPELPLREAAPAFAGAGLELSIDRFRDLPDLSQPAMTLAGPAFDDVAEAGPTMRGHEPIIDAPAQAVASPARTLEPPAMTFSGPLPDDGPALPLFAPDAVDDEPLVKLPAAPRPPLSVRRTPEIPRLRTSQTIERSWQGDAVLQFVEEPEEGVAAYEAVAAAGDFDPPAKAADAPITAMPRPALRVAPADDASPFSRRAVAAIIDHGILLGIDLVVLYFTLRLTDLTFADWRVLPWLPLAAFLLSVKVAYLSAFTTAGGQTIGKMATHIRVVSDDGGGLDAGRALRRAVLGLVSIATAGAPFLTAVTDPLRRGVHDRASGTRVVAVSPH